MAYQYRIIDRNETPALIVCTGSRKSDLECKARNLYKRHRGVILHVERQKIDGSWTHVETITT